jgi:ABC-type transporter Mla subunit MlaD
MTAFLSFILSPIGKFMSAAVVVLAVFGFIYGKGQFDGRKSYKETIQRESNKAVAKATDARNAAVRRFDGGMRDDGFRRD